MVVSQSSFMNSVCSALDDLILPPPFVPCCPTLTIIRCTTFIFSWNNSRSSNIYIGVLSAVPPACLPEPKICTIWYPIFFLILLLLDVMRGTFDSTKYIPGISDNNYQGEEIPLLLYGIMPKDVDFKVH